MAIILVQALEVAACPLPLANKHWYRFPFKTFWATTMRPLIYMQIVFDESLCHCMCHFISLPDEHTFTMSQAALHDGHIYDKRNACVYEYAKPKIRFLPHWLYMSSAVKIVRRSAHARYFKVFLDTHPKPTLDPPPTQILSWAVSSLASFVESVALHIRAFLLQCISSLSSSVESAALRTRVFFLQCNSFSSIQ